MLRIVEREFSELAFDYLLNEEEAKSVIDTFKCNDMANFLRDMYASNNRKEFAITELEPLIITLAESRSIIILPTNKDLVQKAGQIIEEFIIA